MVKVTAVEVSTPPLAVPPMSESVAVAAALPFALGAGGGVEGGVWGGPAGGGVLGGPAVVGLGVLFFPRGGSTAGFGGEGEGPGGGGVPPAVGGTAVVGERDCRRRAAVRVGGRGEA